MSQLPQLLRYLERDDVTEVIIQTGRAPHVMLGGELRPLGKNPVTTPQIEALVEGSPIGPLVPQADTPGVQHVVTMQGRAYRVRFARKGPAVQLRIEAAGGAGASPAATPASPGPQRAAPVASPGPQPRAAALDIDAGRAVTRPAHLTTDDEPGEAPPESGRPTMVGGPPSHVAAEAIPSQMRPAQRRGVTGADVQSSAQDLLTTQPGRRMAPSPTLDATPLAPRVSLEPQTPTPARASTARFEVEGQKAAMGPGGRVVSTFARLVQGARRRKASDLHIASERPVMVRVAGELLPEGAPVPHDEVEAMMMPLLNATQRQTLVTRGYVDFAVEIEGAGRLRANVSQVRGGMKGSFRLVMSPTPTLESLGLPRELGKVTTYHQGLIVISGPNGHGKTTTLAALIDMINSTKAHHILTVEEPVEFVHERKAAVMSQREVGLHTRTFASALKASLREDPDVIVIGELRDRETVEIALSAAETGHLVMATMSTPSAAKTIDRLIDLFPPADQAQVRATLAVALKFIVSQRLLPSTDGGFAAAIEMLTGCPPLSALIRENKLFQLPNLQQRGRAYGMMRFDDSLVELFNAGRISEEVALRYAESKKEMQAAIKPAAPAASPAVTPTAQGGTAAKQLQDIKSKMGNIFGKKEG